MSLEMLERALPALTELGTVAAVTHAPDRTLHDPGPVPCTKGVSPRDPSVAYDIDWDLISRSLGTRLPQDYMDLVHRYQGLVIDNWLGVRMPRPAMEPWYVDGMREHLLELEDAWMTGDTEGHVPYPRPRGLLPWGGSIDGDTFYWRTHPEGPEAWTVVVCGACNDWKEVDRDLTGYLAGLVLGEVEPCSGVPADFPGAAPSISVDSGRVRPPVQ
ncbi:hypothetical protein [Streptomyces odontomachi]|uniref:hypothetical protein n=1 Tax=Streptomyces odontomachi TaxID=2944940 RepID=UPI0021091FF6|nr:hypothetical protein [Streptomyces sp. ODS25]